MRAIELHSTVFICSIFLIYFFSTKDLIPTQRNTSDWFSTNHWWTNCHNNTLQWSTRDDGWALWVFTWCLVFTRSYPLLFSFGTGEESPLADFGLLRLLRKLGCSHEQYSSSFSRLLDSGSKWKLVEMSYWKFPSSEKPILYTGTYT